MTETRSRERNPEAKRARIASAALELFQQHGFADTTIDQIAAAAGVGRRTVFDHFASKDAIVFDQLFDRREQLVQRVAARPASEPPLVSLHTVLRGLCKEGFDRGLLEQVRAVLASDSKLARSQFSMGDRGLEDRIVDVLSARGGSTSQQLHAVTRMAFGWHITAVRTYFKGGRASLLRCYDDAVATCVRAAADLTV